MASINYYLERGNYKVLKFRMNSFSYFEIRASLLLVPPSNKCRSLKLIVIANIIAKLKLFLMLYCQLHFVTRYISVISGIFFEEIFLICFTSTDFCNL